MSARTALGQVVVAGLLLTACGSGQTATSSPPATQIEKTADIPFTTPSAEYPTAGAEFKLDVYAPVGAHGLPLVVFLHGGGATKDSFGFYASLARDIAARGAVVIAPNHGTGIPAPPAGAALRMIDKFGQVANCAVSFAVTHAEDYGADPTRIVLVGHSAGSSVALTIALGPSVSRYPGCLASATSWRAKGLVLWDGDWLLADPTVWGAFEETDMAAFIASATPWKLLDSAPKLPVELVTSTVGLKAYGTRCEVADWLPSRDPTGQIQNDLEAMGALADGCIDIPEESQVLAATMRQRGFQVSTIALPQTSHTSLAPSDQDLIAADAIALTRG